MQPIEFLSELFASCPKNGGTVELRKIGNEDGSIERHFCASPAEADRYIRKWTRDQGDYGVFFGIAQRKPDVRRGRKEDLQAVPVLWVDLDTEKNGWNTDRTLAALKTSQLRPSIVVRSGHGLHLYWLLEDPVLMPEYGTDEYYETLESIESLAKRLGQIFGGDSVQDITRVLRLPGTLNTKGGKKREVSVALDDFSEWRFDDLQRAARRQDQFLNDGEWIDAEKVKAMARARKIGERGHDAVRRYGQDAGFTDRKFTWESLWQHTVYHGGDVRGQFIGLNEATLRGTAILYSRFSGEWSDDMIIDEVLVEVGKIQQRDAPNEHWDWHKERRQIASQLDRFKPRADKFEKKVKANAGRRKDNGRSSGEATRRRREATDQ